MLKALYVTQVLAEYRLSILELLDDEIRREGGTFSVISGTGTAAGRRFGRTGDTSLSVVWADVVRRKVLGRFTYEIANVADLVCRMEPDVVFCNAHLGDRSAQRLRGAYSGPLVGMVCGYENSSQSFALLKRLAWRATRRKLFDHYLGYGYFSREWFNLHGIGSERITYFLNTITGPSPGMCDRRVSNERLKVAYAGTILREKRLDVLLAAARRFPGIDFIVAGDGDDLGRLKDVVSSSDLVNVDFIGKLSIAKTSHLFSTCDVALMPGTGGLMLLQALQAGIPVISSAGDGSGLDIVINGYNGFVATDPSERFICESIHLLVSRPDLLEWMKSNAVESVCGYAPKLTARRLYSGILLAAARARSRAIRDSGH